jgi:hypothetical protein
MQHKTTLTYLAGLFVFTGAVVTLENFHVLHGVSRHWPILLSLLGTGFVLLFIQRQRIDPVLLWLGTFLIALSIFFYYLNMTAWTRLATQWPGFLGVAGLSFLAIAVAQRRPVYAALALVFLGLFVILGLVFSVSTRLWPLSFVVFGLSLLMLDTLRHPKNA